MTAAYRYEAWATRNRVIRGVLTADSFENAYRDLAMRGLIVTRLDSAADPHSRVRAVMDGRPSRGWHAEFFRACADLCAAGIPLRTALAITRGDDRSGLAGEIIDAVIADVDGGSTLAQALARRAGAFSRETIAMVAAGERSGALEQALERIAELYERTAHFRRSVAASLFYPCIVIAGAVIVLAVLAGTAVPAMEALSASMHVAPSGVSAAVFAVAHWIRSPSAWLCGLATSLVLVAVLRYWNADQGGAGRWFRIGALLGAMPVVGGIMIDAARGRWFRVLALLLRCGAPASQALEAAEAVLPATLRSKARIVGEALEHGHDLCDAFQRCGLAGSADLHLIAAGEQRGALDIAFERIAERLERDANARLAHLVALVEPALILILGAGVAVMVFALLSPLYDMIGRIS